MPRSSRAGYGTPIGVDGEAGQQLQQLALERRMKKFGNRVALFALSWLAAALFVMLPIKQPPNAVQLFPTWVTPLNYFIDFAMFITIYYGIHRRKSAVWKISPVLIWIFIFQFSCFPLWYMINRHLPWIPFLFIVAILAIGGIFFCVWWSKQKDYFVR